MAQQSLIVNPRPADSFLELAVVARALRRVLSEHWSLAARFEHASVASFNRFSLELLAVGAPAELVAAANLAALQEVEHARGCFAAASAYTGQSVLHAQLRRCLRRGERPRHLLSDPISAGLGRSGRAVPAGGDNSVTDPFAHNPADTPQDGSCCYLVGSISYTGRPFIVEGTQLIAPVVLRSDWLLV